MESIETRPSADFLVVDDDETYCSQVVHALKSRGFSAMGCDGVESAMAVLNSHSISRALVDLKMPGQNGLTLIEYLATNFSECDAVVMTGYGSITTALSAIKLGAMNYLTKPVSITEILEAFKEDAARQFELPIPSLSQVEWDHIQRVICECEGNISQAAKLLGMHRRSLQRKLQKPPVRIS